MLSYCLNVHPGTSLESVREAVLVKAPEVYRHLCATSEFEGPRGVGIWLPSEAAKAVEGHAAEFAAEVKRAGLTCHTFNGFPFGAFHGTRVKDAVYLPDWSSRERVEHTLRLARILTAFLEEGDAGSISTVPIGYRAHFNEPKLHLAEANLMAVAAGLDAIHAESGRRIRLALEPEPDCILDSVGATVSFFDQFIPDNVRHVIGTCLDLTHVAVEFETPSATLDTLTAAKIPIYKVQIGSALIGDESSDFEPFADTVYLHQTKVSTEGGIHDYPDLPEALSAKRRGEWRVHYHVPLIWNGHESLRSSRGDLTPEFFAKAHALGIDTFEVETYTLGIFPDKSLSDTEILAGELAWVNERFA